MRIIDWDVGIFSIFCYFHNIHLLHVVKRNGEMLFVFTYLVKLQAVKHVHFKCIRCIWSIFRFKLKSPIDERDRENITLNRSLNSIVSIELAGRHVIWVMYYYHPWIKSINWHRQTENHIHSEAISTHSIVCWMMIQLIKLRKNLDT